jgi:hypothetical protein
MVATGKRTAANAARLFNVHPATIFRLLARAGGEVAIGKMDRYTKRQKSYGKEFS